MLTWSLIVGSLSHRHYPISLDRIPSTFDYGTVHFVSGAAMRRSRRISLQLTLLALPVFTGLGALADDARFTSEPLNLRGGSVTLQPTQVPAPNASSERAPAARPAPRATVRRWSAAPSAETAGAAPRSAPVESERVIVSLERRITPQEREQLAARGIEIGEYLSGTNYTARVRHARIETLVQQSAGINTVIRLVPLDEANAHVKIDPALSTREGAAALPPPDPGAGPTTRNAADAARTTVNVQLWPDADVAAAETAIRALGRITRVSKFTRKLQVEVDAHEVIERIARLKSVMLVSPAYAPKAQNTHVTANIGVPVAAAPPYSLTGTGIKVGVWDAGHVAARHPALNGRLLVDLDREQTLRRDNVHATHVAGTIAGSGEYEAPATSATSKARESETPGFGEEVAPPPPGTAAARPAPSATEDDGLQARYPGVAPMATVLSFDFYNAADELIGMLADDPAALDLVNNSWNANLSASSCNVLASYNALDAVHFDALVAGEVAGQPVRRIPVLFSAGNSRDDGICGMSSGSGYQNFRSVLPPATAKNVITVGAIDADDNSMTSFSSWGPTASGRLKPDVVAPGCRQHVSADRGILSAVPATGIGRMCGTSMATPAVAGTVALLIERMIARGVDRTAVFPSTYKALLIHAASDLGRPGPDFEFGYGRVQIAPMLELIDQQAFQQSSLASEGTVETHVVDIAPGVRQLKATVVWDDPPTSSLSDDSLANDLDLVVTAPNGATHLPFLLNAAPGQERLPARPGVDRLNVVEQVVVRDPAPGSWRVEIRAARLGQLQPGGQTFSLLISSQ